MLQGFADCSVVNINDSPSSVVLGTLGDVSAPLDERMGKGGGVQWIILTVCIQIGEPATRDREAGDRFNISVSVWGWCKLAAPTFPLSPSTHHLHSTSLPGDDDGCGGAVAAVGQLASYWKGRLGGQPAWGLLEACQGCWGAWALLSRMHEQETQQIYINAQYIQESSEITL